MAKKAFLNDANLDRLLAALEAPVATPVSRPARNLKSGGLTLGDWKPPTARKGNKGAPKKKNEGRVSSVFHRVIDVLSRGNYASAEAFKEGFDPNTKAFYEPKEALKGFWSGLRGKEKTRFSEVLKQHGHTGRGMGTLGVGLDIFADPLTYLGVGLIGRGAQGAAGASRVARIGEAATPDVVRLGVDVARGTKKVARKVAGKSTPIASPKTVSNIRQAGNNAAVLKALQTLQSSLRTTVTSDPREAAALTARIVAKTGAKSQAKVVDQILAGKQPEFSVEHLVPATPEIAALQAKTAGVLAPKKTAKKTAPKAATKSIDIEAEATRLTDLRYDKEMGATAGDRMSDLRAAVASGDPNAIRNLRAIESDETYTKWRNAAKKRLANAPKPVPAAAVAPVVETPARTAPEIIATTPAPTAPPASTSDRLVATAQALDKRQQSAAQSAVEHIRDTITPGGKKYENLKKANVGGAQGPHTEFTYPKQVNAFNKARDELLNADGWVKGTNRTAIMADPNWIKRVVAVQKHIEEVMGASGKAARADRNDPTPLRLSDFFDRMEPHEILRGAENEKFLTQIMTKQTGIKRFDDMYEEVKAGSHVSEAARIRPVVETILETMHTATKNPLDEAVPDLVSGGARSAATSAAREAEVSEVGQKLVSEVAGEAAVAAKATPTDDGVHLVGNLVSNTEKAREAATVGKAEDAAIPLARLALDRDRYLGIYMGGKPVARIVNLSKLGSKGRAIGENAGLRKFFDAMDATEDWFALSFRTAFGRDEAGNVVSMGADVKRLDRAAVNNANQRSHAAMEAYQQIFRGTDPDTRLKMLSDAQEQADHPIAQRMANLIDTAKRNGLTPQMINDAMVKHYKKNDDIPFKFEAAKVDALGRGRKFDDWFDSWTAAAPKGDIAQHLMKLETAVDKAVVQQHVILNFATRFGSTATAPGLKSGKDIHPLLAKHNFAPEDLEGMKNYLSMTREFGEESSELMKHFDQVQGVWKTMATRINPQYYARNGVGEVFINWMHGVNSVKPYRWAAKTVSWRNPPEVAVDALTSGAPQVTAGTVLFKHPKYGEITADIAWKGYNQFGARQTFAITDNLTDAGIQKPAGRVMGALNRVADYEESTLRMAHFLDHVSKSKARNLVEAMEDAAATVNRAHGDYADLTRFERKVMKRIIPFYTWQRKVTPILLESALRNPGKVMVYPKIQIAIAQNYGLELDNANPFPQPDQIMPDWMQEAAQVPYYHKTNGNIVMGDPSNPFNDQVKQLNHPVETAGSMLTPFAKIPTEMIVRRTDKNENGTQFFGNIPIRDKTEYLADQIPLLSTINRLTRRDILHGGQERTKVNAEGERVSVYGTDEQGVNTIAILNWLTAAGLQENTERRQKSGEFDLKEREAKAAKKAREEAAKK